METREWHRRLMEVSSWWLEDFCPPFLSTRWTRRRTSSASSNNNSLKISNSRVHKTRQHRSMPHIRYSAHSITVTMTVLAFRRPCNIYLMTLLQITPMPTSTTTISGKNKPSNTRMQMLGHLTLRLNTSPSRRVFSTSPSSVRESNNKLKTNSKSSKLLATNL